jgi:hypothetical protein
MKAYFMETVNPGDVFRVINIQYEAGKNAVVNLERVNDEEKTR